MRSFLKLSTTALLLLHNPSLRVSHRSNLTWFPYCLISISLNSGTKTQVSSSVWTIYSTPLEYILQCMLKLASILWLKSNTVHVSHVKLWINRITILDLELAAYNRSAACGETEPFGIVKAALGYGTSMCLKLLYFYAQDWTVVLWVIWMY